MSALIAAFDRLRPALDEVTKGTGTPLVEARLSAPLAHPEVVLCTFGNYRQGLNYERRMPSFVLKPADAIVGPNATVTLPDVDFGVIHHEAELAVVIGKGGRDIAMNDVLDHVFGYTAAIDLNARGILDNQGVVVNGFEGFGPIGPWIVTADEIGNPQDLTVKLWADGQLRQHYVTHDMEYSVAELISFASTMTTFEPGDVILCGTDYRGVGPVQGDETYTIEIERIGSFAIKVRDSRGRRWPSEVDLRAGQAIETMRINAGPFDPTSAYTPILPSQGPSA
jgi:2-keto-4-pentenoate hydratase/2-oxohepta-3-ene-1,7-dioic acid hydratase in catechol pathway